MFFQVSLSGDISFAGAIVCLIMSIIRKTCQTDKVILAIECSATIHDCEIIVFCPGFLRDANLQSA
jgi:hypothetical protein